MNIRNFYKSFPENIRKEINKQLLVSWTYNSSAIEGNSFTLGDTFFFLLHGTTIKGRSFYEHCEIKGHANAVEVINSFFINKEYFSEEDLKELHKIVVPNVVDIYEPVGEYKIESNGTLVYKDNGSEFCFYPSPKDSEKMIKDWIVLFNQYNSYPDLTEKEALYIFVDLSLKFTSIHPFANGNGRLARLLSNIPLIKKGYPPIIIDKEKRQEYIMLLNRVSLPDPNYKIEQPFPKKALKEYTEFCRESWNNTYKIIQNVTKNIRKDTEESHGMNM